MILLVTASWLVTRRLRTSAPIGRGQHELESMVVFILAAVEGVTRHDARPYLPFVGTLFLFIVLSNILSIVPGFQPPTGSLSTTAALAVLVFLAVPYFGISRVGLGNYLRSYLQPSPFML